MVSDPNTRFCEQVRCNLISGLLRTVNSNQRMPLPIEVFELSDVVLRDDAAETGAYNYRRLAAVRYGKASAFEVR